MARPRSRSRSKNVYRKLLPSEARAILQAREEGFARRDIEAVFARSLATLDKLFKGLPPPACGFKATYGSRYRKPHYNFNRLIEIHDSWQRGQHS